MRLFYPLLYIAIAFSAAQEYDEEGPYGYDGEHYGGRESDHAANSIPTKADHKEHKELGYSPGSGLRSIAEGSLNSAKTAVHNQDAAGHQAAYVAKNTLAKAAAGASATAQAALAGKSILLRGLEQQLRDAEVSLRGEKQQLMQAQRSADSTRKAAQEARAHVNVLTHTLNAAQQAADHVTQAASEAAGELAAQQAMVGAAEQRVETLSRQLHGVRIDFEATREAAMKARAAAQAAAANAAAAAAKAAHDLNKSAHPHGHDGRHDGDDQHHAGTGPQPKKEPAKKEEGGGGKFVKEIEDNAFTDNVFEMFPFEKQN